MSASTGAPLRGIRVLLTRPASLIETWAGPLAAAGATPLAYPTIEVSPPPSWALLDAAAAHLPSYDWAIFTSAAAARFALSRHPSLIAASQPTSSASLKIAAVGSETARALEDLGVVVSLVPADQRQEGLLESFADLPPGTRILMPHAIGGRDDLAIALRARGCIVDVVPASQTTPVRPATPPPPFDIAVFASPSALDAFVASQGTDPLRALPLVAIGPSTATAAAAHGIEPLLADAPNIAAIIAAIAKLVPLRGKS